MKIGIFDSGLGGLTALSEAKSLYPNHDLIYFGDTGRVPYGGRSKETLVRYAKQDARFLLSKGAEVILVACGTVSSNCMDELRSEFSVPIIGVVDAAAAAAVEKTVNKKIGIIGTAATINSGAYEKRIKELSPECECVSVPCPLFTPLVENGFLSDDPVTIEIARRYLEPIGLFGADTLILGCTHYPIIAKCISSHLPGTTLISSGKEGARALSGFLPEKSERVGSERFYVSDMGGDFTSVASVFLDEDISPLTEKVDITNY